MDKRAIIIDLEGTLIPTNHKFAILLDLNGTLIYRSRTEIPDVKVPHKHLRGQYIYARPGAAEAIQKLSKHFDVYICTSMIMKNAVASIGVIFDSSTSDDNGVPPCITAILDRDYAKSDPSKDRGDPWDTIRDMDKIWNKIAPHGETTSILVDNELRKCLNAHRNCLLIPEVYVDELRNGDTTVLTELTEYFTRLRDTNTSDVRNYLEKHPIVQSISDGSITNDIERLFDEMRLNTANCTLSIDHIDGSELILIDFRNNLKAIVRLPLPNGVRLERKIALDRFIKLPIQKTLVSLSSDNAGLANV
jgi:hypothetical protein